MARKRKTISKEPDRILPERKHECKFCNKKYSSEKTLISHMCVKKRRWADRNTVGARLGFNIFNRFIKISTNSKREKTYEEFSASSFYNDFVKFAKYLVDLNPVNAEKFIDYVIVNGVKLKDWPKDRTYDAFLKDFVTKELVERALERTISEMSKWAEENNSHYSKFFAECHPNEAAWLIRSGRISPWVFFLADSSKELMVRMTDDHERIIANTADTKFWQKKLLADKEDTQFAVTVLENAGL